MSGGCCCSLLLLDTSAVYTHPTYELGDYLLFPRGMGLACQSLVLCCLVSPWSIQPIYPSLLLSLTRLVGGGSVVAVLLPCCRLRRRRLGGASGRHGRSSLGFPGSGSGGAFANGSSFSSRGANLSGGGGSGGGDEEEDEEQDEGQMAEDASLMFLTAIRQVSGKGRTPGRPVCISLGPEFVELLYVHLEPPIAAFGMRMELQWREATMDERR